MKPSPSLAGTPLAERTAAARASARRRRIDAAAVTAGADTAGPVPAARVKPATPTTPAHRRRMRQHAAALGVKPLVHGSDLSHR